MTPIQVQMLVDILYENSEIASGKLPANSFTREERMKKWEAVATLLNSKDLGAQKTPEQWKKSWADLKCATRSKAAKLELAGGTDLMNEKLSNLEKRVLQLSGDVTVKDTQESDSKVNQKPTSELSLKNLEADLAKTEEDLLKVLKKPNQIVLPTTMSKILEERARKCVQVPMQVPIVANVTASEDEKKKIDIVELDCPVSPVNSSDDGDTQCQEDDSDDNIIYDDSDNHPEIAVNHEISYETLSSLPKKRKMSSDDKPSATSSGSFISVFQRQIETQTAVLKEQTSIMRDIAKSLRLIANSLHDS